MVEPAPRSGLAGWWDRLVGPGATPTEFWLTLGAALAGGLAVLFYAHGQQPPWSLAQLLAATALAADTAGGVAAAAASPAKRWWHPPGPGAPWRLAFCLAHGFHLLVVAWLFRGGDWVYLAAFYAYLAGGAWAVLRVPAHLQRAVALLLVLGAVFLNTYGLAPAQGLEWFVPALFLKLFGAYLPAEAARAESQRVA